MKILIKVRITWKIKLLETTNVKCLSIGRVRKEEPQKVQEMNQWIGKSIRKLLVEDRVRQQDKSMKTNCGDEKMERSPIR
jgi:hypothetical protein